MLRVQLPPYTDLLPLTGLDCDPGSQPQPGLALAGALSLSNNFFYVQNYFCIYIHELQVSSLHVMSLSRFCYQDAAIGMS